MSPEMRNDPEGLNGGTVILVVTHKACWMPDLPGYRPIQVGPGTTIRSDWLRDDTGEQISEKNPTFCELTGLYWAWKNMDAEIVGLCHYRRYLGSRRRKGDKKNRLLTEDEIRALLAEHDAILPVKRHYWIETRESQYAHAHHAEDLRCVEGILRERYPEYLPAWEKMLASRSGHICNMFIMRKKTADEYCRWLFDILFEAEKRLDISGYSGKDRRVFGYLGERLLDVWADTNRLQYAEVPMIVTENQHWIRKAASFIGRKLSGGKREGKC